MSWRARAVHAQLAAAAVLLGACGGAGGLREGVPPTDPVAEVSPEELFATGMSAASQGDYLRGEQYLAAAGARGYDETQVIGPLVRVCVAASRLRQALLYAQPYLRSHPDDWRLRFVVATVLLALDRVPEARAELERVVIAAPEVPEPHFVLGSLLREHLRDEPAAKPHLERYLALAPEGGHADEARIALTTPLPAPTEPTPMPTLDPAPGTPSLTPAATSPAVTAPAATPVGAAPTTATPTAPTAPTRTSPMRLPRRNDPVTPTATGTP